MPPPLASGLDDVLHAQGLSGSEDPRTLCRGMAARHYENFPVLSWAVPGRLRDDVAAVYAFCRAVDDLGDEAPGDRPALLDAWEADLLRIWDGAPRHPIHRALADTVRRHDIPPEPFRRLVQANRMDQTLSRHPDFASLREYCRHSADPVGRLVLYLFGHRDPERQRLSDATCTGLQLANFWQDIPGDLASRGRIYLPAEDLARFGVTEADLTQVPASKPVRDLMAFETARARALFAEGLGLLDLLQGRARWMVAAFSAGGLAILDALAAQDYAPSPRPALTGTAKRCLLLGTGWRLLTGTRGSALCPTVTRQDAAGP